MKRFRLQAELTISVYTYVDAETLETAIYEAGNRGVEAYNWGDKQQPLVSWISDDFDGEVKNITDISDE